MQKTYIFKVVHIDDSVTYVVSERGHQAMKIAERWTGTEVDSLSDGPELKEPYGDTITDSDGVVHDLINEANV